jgi:rubrerythrin
MVKKYSVFEIFQVAEKIERNGVEFYRKAAGMFSDAKMKGVLLQLADWEVEHERHFREMRREYVKEMNEMVEFNPAAVVTENPQAIDGLSLSVIGPNKALELTGKEDKGEMLEKALAIEQETVRFYEELGRSVRDLGGKYEAGKILAEEKGHVKTIERLLGKG